MKYITITKECPICKTEFTTKQGHPREKQTCSYGCSNTYFRSGPNNPNYKSTEEVTTSTSYARFIRLCFRYHKKECVICGEKNIVAVHHFDHNHGNNSVDNLVPLCPTHHQYVHSKYCNTILPEIELYLKTFKETFDISVQPYVIISGKQVTLEHRPFPEST